MKRLNNIILLGLCSLLLIACSDKSISSEQLEITKPPENRFTFISGVDELGDSYAGIDNYTAIEGTSHDKSTLSVIIDGTVVDHIVPDNQGIFKYFKKIGDKKTRFVFSDDDNLNVGDKKIKEKDLKNLKVVNIYPNDSYLSQLSKEIKYAPDDVFYLNEEAIILDYKGNPLYSLKITDVTSKISQDLGNEKSENVIEISYEYKNYSYELPFEVSSQFLNVENSIDSIDSGTNIQNGHTKVSNGESATATTWFVMSEPVQGLKSINITYGEDFSLGFYASLNFEIPLN